MEDDKALRGVLLLAAFREKEGKGDRIGTTADGKKAEEPAKPAKTAKTAKTDKAEAEVSDPAKTEQSAPEQKK